MNYKRLMTLALALLATLTIQAQDYGYQLKVGDAFTVTAMIDQDIKQSVMGQEMTTTQKITTVDKYEVVEVTAGGFKFKTTGISRKMKSEGPGGNLDIDSSLEGDTHLAFKVLTGKSFFIEMNRYGRVLEITGLDDLATGIRADLSGTALEASADDLILAYDESTLTTAFEGQFFIYQEPGSEWAREYKADMGNLPVSVTMDFAWTTEGEEIYSKGQMNLSGEIEAGGQVMDASMEGDQVSTFHIDKETGIGTKITTTQELTGSLMMGTMTIPMELKTQVTVTVER